MASRVPTNPIATPRTLAARELTAGYDGTTILDGLNVAVPEGQISVIIGANGCGKSTLLKTLARLLKPQRGSVVLDGHDIHALPTKQLAQ